MVDLTRYSNNQYFPGSKLKIILWYVTSYLIFQSQIPFPTLVKCIILKLFGAQIGRNIVIKPRVNIKYPWFLEIHNNTWIGEGVWIDNLTEVSIHNNVCISQGAYLLTGSHNYKKNSFDLIVKPIVLENGVWIGAKAIVCPGITCKANSVLAVGSVATSDLESSGIYQGNPAILKRYREMTN